MIYFCAASLTHPHVVPWPLVIYSFLLLPCYLLCIFSIIVVKERLDYPIPWEKTLLAKDVKSCFSSLSIVETPLEIRETSSLSGRWLGYLA